MGSGKKAECLLFSTVHYIPDRPQRRCDREMAKQNANKAILSPF